ncbi:MAG: hypothetical protein IJF22_02770 [Clostridia bacterium]|nr:hypothetical protein [Clostridia bacterium]
MKEQKTQNERVKLPNNTIHLFVEPNSQAGLFRFAIINPKKTHVKFLHNEAICTKKEAEKSTSKYLIERKPQRYIDIIHTITDFGIEPEYDPYDDYDNYYYEDYDHNNEPKFVSKTYTHDQVEKMHDILKPLLKKEGEEIPLAMYLEIETQFVKFQKEILKELELDQQATEAYCNF